MSGVELATQVGWIRGDGHRLRVEDRGDGAAAHLVARRHEVDRLADDRGDRRTPPHGLSRDFLVAILIQGIWSQ